MRIAAPRFPATIRRVPDATHITTHHPDGRWQVDGKFFRRGGRRVWAAVVTYGPFPGGMPADPTADFQRITDAGFNAIRIYQMPDSAFLDAAATCGLGVFAGLPWGMHADFLASPRLLAEAHVALGESLRRIGGHPALAAVLVGNEIPGDLVRWMGPVRVRHALETLIATGRAAAPDCLFGYANFPTTEYLELENADFTAMNVYLEDAGAFQAYLRRLHHIAGDRPVMISEFGLDTRRNGHANQARLLGDAIRIAHQQEAAGIAIYAWSDRWWNGHDVTDWDFGITDRLGNAKPALAACRDALRQTGPTPHPNDSALAPEWPFSVIICTRNGRARIGRCLDACRSMIGENIEVIVVDDGSTDGTAAFVATRFPDVRLLELPPSGLSAARNAGAAAASGRVLAFTDDDCEPDAEWLLRLRRAFVTSGGLFAAIGGPNLPPPPLDEAQAVVAAAPGAPSHVMIDDIEAEHLPGCNIAVTREAFDGIGGFDPAFHTAGDDVDFCWRLRDAGMRLGFSPGAFVWHWRRPTISGFLRQQTGYGRAEKMLIRKHPQRFTARGHTRWLGFVYGGGPVRVSTGDTIYHGGMGAAGYQSLVRRMLPLRGLHAAFDTASARIALVMIRLLQPGLRAWARSRRWAWPGRLASPAQSMPPPDDELRVPTTTGGSHDSIIGTFLADGWSPAGATAQWDLEKNHARLQLATERGDGQTSAILIRIWGARRNELPSEVIRDFIRQ
jgi:GT2 family glycosyltransferase